MREKGDDREDDAAFSPIPNCSRQQRQRFKNPKMPVKLSKEVLDMTQMQWPAGGADGGKGGKKRKGSFSVLF